ncbi:MAG TPA: DMT family transporter [Steroidobacteraceae bacterium]|nr:DMT family transporter [Steroidobacteraceae bacterium]
MPTPLIYALVVLIWGTTWYAIKFQLGVVAPEVSLVYRFALAAACVFFYARATGSSLKLTLRDHGMVALQGVTLFCLNYWMTYLSTQYLTSGLVAVLFTAIIFFNVVNGRIFLGTPVERRVLAAAGAGVLGVALLFLPELQDALHDPTIGRGAVLALVATYVASLGNMAASRNTRGGLPVVTVNAYGLAYGTLGLAVIAAIRGAPLEFDPHWPYVVSLLYLSLGGTALAFGLYLALIRKIGAARASYTSVLFPVVALVVSTLFEGYAWSLPAVVGLAVLVAGNALALGGPRKDAGRVKPELVEER